MPLELIYLALVWMLMALLSSRLSCLVRGPISPVNVLKTGMGVEQARVLASILKENPALKSLCGNAGGETELGMSGKEIGIEGAIMLALEADHR
jgi:hypothetical protein